MDWGLMFVSELLTNISIMKRSNKLLEKRKDFISDYVAKNENKQMKLIVLELSERLFLSERTIYNILGSK